MEKAVRGTRWHFKSRLCLEAECVPSLSHRPRQAGPPLRALTHRQRPGRQAVSGQQGSGYKAAFGSVLKPRGADQSGPYLGLMQSLPYSALPPEVGAMTTGQHEAQTRAPAKRALAPPHGPDAGQDAWPKHVCSLNSGLAAKSLSNLEPGKACYHLQVWSWSFLRPECQLVLRSWLHSLPPRSKSFFLSFG